MEYVADVRLVDAHAKGDGGHHDGTGLCHEDLLVLQAHVRIQPCVIGQGGNAILLEQCRCAFGALPGKAVDNAALSPVPLHKAQQLRCAGCARPHGEMNVGPIEAEGEHLWRPVEQLVADVPARLRIGRGREGRDRHFGKQRAQLGQPFVVGTKGRAPARDAVGLVNGDERHRQIL